MMRPTSLATLTVSQFKKITVDGKYAWFVSGAVGRACGSSKTSRGGWNAIGDKVPEIPIWEESHEGGTINFYKDIDIYMDIRSKLEVATNLFFLAANYSAKKQSEFLRSSTWTGSLLWVALKQLV